MKAGFRLPAERELAGSYGCARMTVRRALRDLEAEGLIVRRRGSGTFVVDLNPISNVLTIKDICKEIAERGHKHHSILLSRSKIEGWHVRCGGNEDRIRRGGLPLRSDPLRERRTHPVRGAILNPALAPDFLTLDPEAHTASSYLFERAPLTGAEQGEAVNADATLAAHLNVTSGAALLLVFRRTLSQGKVASVARLYHPGHAYRLLGVFSTEP